MAIRASGAAFGASVQAGTGTGTARVGGTYASFVSGTGVGNVGAGDDALWTLPSLPANTLAANGDRIEIIAEVATAANANNKNVGVTVGGTQITTTGNTAANNGNLRVAIGIVRVDATHVNVHLLAMNQGTTTLGNRSVNLAVSDLSANTLALVVTGASPTTGAANDVLLYSGIAEFKPAK